MAVNTEELCAIVEDTAKCPKLLRATVRMIVGAIIGIAAVAGLGLQARASAAESMDAAKEAKRSVEALRDMTDTQYKSIQRQLDSVIQLLKDR